MTASDRDSDAARANEEKSFSSALLPASNFDHELLLFNQVLTKRYSPPAQSINQPSLTRPHSHRGSYDVVKYAARYHCSRCSGRLPLTGRLFPFQQSVFREASAFAAAASYQGELDETAAATC